MGQFVLTGMFALGIPDNTRGCDLLLMRQADDTSKFEDSDERGERGEL